MTDPIRYRYNTDEVNLLESIRRSREYTNGAPFSGTPPILVYNDGTEVNTVEEVKKMQAEADAAKKAPSANNADVLQHLQHRRGPGRPKSAKTPSAPQLSLEEATPAGMLDEPVEVEEPAAKLPSGSQDKRDAQVQEPTMPSKPKQNLPGTTASAHGNVAKEVPLEAIHEAIEQGFYLQGVKIKLQHKNHRGIPVYLAEAILPLETLADIETLIKEQWGGGTFRVTALDPETGKPARAIPPFEVLIHAPPRISPNGTVVPPGVSIPPPGNPFQQQQGAPMSSPWFSHAPVVPGNIPGQMMTGAQSQPWGFQQPGFQAAPVAMPAGYPAHPAPVMSMSPDAIAMHELQSTKVQLAREQSARQRDQDSFNKKLELLQQQIAENRLKEEDRARQHESAQLRDMIRQIEERSRQALEQERTRRPMFDMTAFAAVVGAVVPVFTALISSRNDQSNKSLEVQASGVNSLMKATLERVDSQGRWLKELLPIIIPAMTPLVKSWLETKSPAAQADLVATLSENHLTSISMMAKLVNDMASQAPEPPVWLPIFQQALTTIVSGVDSLAKSTKSSVGLPVQSAHMPAPQPMQQQPTLTPAQVASGMRTPMQTPVQTVPQPSPLTGAQVAQLLVAAPEVPQDLKTREWLEIVAMLHDRVAVEQVAKVFVDHMQKLDKNLPSMLQGFWDTDDPDAMLKSLFSNLPIWQWDANYVVAFINKAMESLEPEDVSKKDETGAPGVVDFFNVGAMMSS